MTPNRNKASLTRDFVLATVVIVAGLSLSGISFERLASQTQMAQATPPLQSTPGAQDKPTAPTTEPATTGSARPTEIKPQPAQPDADAQKAGVQPVLPQAPAEQIGTPIKPR